jgi:hypothetical protein
MPVISPMMLTMRREPSYKRDACSNQVQPTEIWLRVFSGIFDTSHHAIIFQDEPPSARAV